MTTSSVIREVFQERVYQISKGYDAANDDRNTEKDWFNWIDKYQDESVLGNGRGTRQNLLAVAALAVAAVEAFDRNNGFPK